jgi:hypothetical protein
LNPFPTSEMLALLLLIVFLFVFFFPSVFESKGSRYSKPKRVTDTQSEESGGQKHRIALAPFLDLEDIEKEGDKENPSKRVTPHAYNPILVLANIES